MTPTTQQLIEEILKGFDEMYPENIKLEGVEAWNPREHLKAFIKLGLKQVAAHAKAEAVEEIEKFLREKDEDKWKDANHCTCLAYCIHELFCTDDGSSCTCSQVKQLLVECKKEEKILGFPIKVHNKETEPPICEKCGFSLVDSTQAACNCGAYKW